MNDKPKLGLPLEYQKMPEYFDAHNIGPDTEAKNALIERLLKEQNVKSVLDMTCGTGSQVFYLHERGYEVVGSDFSPALIEQARKKAKSQGQDIRFLNGDMRDLRVGQFDAVITIFNAIGHVTKLGFSKTLQNIHENLKEGGIYVFDIFNLDAITDQVIDDFDVDIENVVGDVKIHHIQHSEFDRENRFLISHDYNTFLKEGHEPEIHTNTFSLQIYTAEELREMLIQTGFEIVHQYDMDGNDFVANKSLNILMVARKKSYEK